MKFVRVHYKLITPLAFRESHKGSISPLFKSASLKVDEQILKLKEITNREIEKIGLEEAHSSLRSCILLFWAFALVILIAIIVLV